MVHRTRLYYQPGQNAAAALVLRLGTQELNREIRMKKIARNEFDPGCPCRGSGVDRGAIVKRLRPQ
jgi:hypothetical protein